MSDKADRSDPLEGHWVGSWVNYGGTDRGRIEGHITASKDGTYRATLDTWGVLDVTRFDVLLEAAQQGGEILLEGRGEARQVAGRVSHASEGPLTLSGEIWRGRLLGHWEFDPDNPAMATHTWSKGDFRLWRASTEPGELHAWDETDIYWHQEAAAFRDASGSTMLAKKPESEHPDALLAEGSGQDEAATGDESGEQPADAAREQRAVAEKSIAVLDFANEGPSVELAYLREALAEMLTGDLSGYEGLRVVERNRVVAYLRETQLGEAGLTEEATAQRAGQELAADFFLSGSFSGDHGRINVKVSLLRPGELGPEVQWEHTAPASDLFKLERELVGKVLAWLKLGAGVHRAAPKPVPGPAPTIAVLPFRNLSPSAHLDSLQVGIADLLQASLTAFEGVELVDREKLDDVLSEQRLSVAGAVNPEAAVRVGKLLGAQRMIFGSFVEIEGVLRVEARLVDTQTASILKSETAQWPTRDFGDLIEDLTLRLVRDLAIEPPPNAAELLRAAIPTRNLEAAVHYSHGVRAYHEGDRAEAARHFERSLLLDQDNMWAHVRRTDCYWTMEDWDRTIEAALKGLGRQPRSPGLTRSEFSVRFDMYSWLARACERANRYEESVDLLKQAIDESVAQHEFYGALAMRRLYSEALFHLNRTSEAIAMFEQALADAEARGAMLEYYDLLTEAHMFLVNEPMRQSRGRPAQEAAVKSLEVYDRLLEAEREAGGLAWLRWARVYVPGAESPSFSGASGDAEEPPASPEETERRLRRAMQLFRWLPECVWRSHVSLAELYIRQRKGNEAIEQLRYVIEHWDDASFQALPCALEFGKFDWWEWLDTVLWAQNQIAAIRQSQGNRQQAVAEFQRLVHDFGVAHVSMIYGQRKLQQVQSVGAEVEFPEQATLIVGGGADAYRSWRYVLEPRRYTVHSYPLHLLTSAHLAPYRLVVLVRQGEMALVHSQSSYVG